jgi:hypothetical protein
MVKNEEMSRRTILAAAGAAGMGALAMSAPAEADEDVPKVTERESADVPNSGAMKSQSLVTELRGTVGPAGSAGTSAAALGFFFGRTVPDAQPGRNVLTLTIPNGTQVISVWMTEWIGGNKSHAGGAFYYTRSVQLFQNGSRCRVIFDLDWNSSLPAGYQVILA